MMMWASIMIHLRMRRMSDSVGSVPFSSQVWNQDCRAMDTRADITPTTRNRSTLMCSMGWAMYQSVPLKPRMMRVMPLVATMAPQIM